MDLHLDGYDGEHGGYLVVRTYRPPMTRHTFAWFVDEAEAKRFIEIYKHFGDVEEDRASRSARASND